MHPGLLGTSLLQHRVKGDESRKDNVDCDTGILRRLREQLSEQQEAIGLD